MHGEAESAFRAFREPGRPRELARAWEALLLNPHRCERVELAARPDDGAIEMTTFDVSRETAASDQVVLVRAPFE